MNGRSLGMGLAQAMAVMACFAWVTTTTVDAAGSTSASMSVSATVSNNCTISVDPLSFGAYDPIGMNSAAHLDATSAVVITCTKGAVPTIGMSTGANASGSTRRLASGGGYLTYELYADSSRSTVWGSSGSDLYTPTAAPSKSSRTYTIYGRISGGQDVLAGTYSDVVTATVNF